MTRDGAAARQAPYIRQPSQAIHATQPRSRDNWDAKTVFVDGAYQAPDIWYGKDGSSFHPGLHYYVGGNSKVYGSALFRLRECDFGELRHKDGISPAWPLGYDVLEPYYTKAEALFHVHGQRGEDPTEPWSSAPYAYPPVQGRRQVASVTANAAQVLWTRIASPGHARRIAERIMRPDMFSGWGIRTLSSEHERFDPLAYQQDSVWAFDNALIVSGLRRYGADAAAPRVTAAKLDAADGFRLGRLPEFVAGHQREPGDGPIHTLRADPLQAWSAASVPFMVTELLGLQADGFAQRLHVRRPLLPDGVDRLELHDVRVAGATVSLASTRSASEVQVEIVGGGDRLELVVDRDAA